MSSSVSSSSLFVPTSTGLLLRRCNFSLLNSSPPILVTRRSTSPKFRLSSSLAEKSIEFSWFSSEKSAVDDYGGWAIVEAPTLKKKKEGLPPFLLVGIGTSIVALLAAIAHFSLSRKGVAVKISSPLNALHGILRVSAPNEASKSKTMDHDALPSDTVVPEASLESVDDVAVETVVLERNHLKRQEVGLGRVIISVAADSTQQEALLMLKKLKIIEDDVKADELCTRREYARWLVRANSLLERNPKHRIVPLVLLSGSIFAAFDDVSIDDPDFGSIQALAEAGIILSRLSGKNSSSGCYDSEDQGGVYFLPERFISRQDLIDWKAQLEYEVMPGVNEKISKTNMGFMDTREIGSDVSPGLFMDMLASDKSILRKVFGQLKRFQPDKPSTKAQAAVALTSGRMIQVIHADLSRLDAENSWRQNAMEEIRSDILNRGDIQSCWDGKLEEERIRAFEVDGVYLAAIYDLEQEKMVQENTLAQYLKEKAAMDCQNQLLLSLKEEVNEMSERLACEKAQQADEQRNLQYLLTDSEVKLEGILGAKSILEAEIEALQILRSWIEDEARKSQARAKVLEEVGRRWKWDD
ncbi:Myosin-4 like [Actinidia chinensis var. chinensis]|uniref:Myosin-4 like n=1 Tax=Actinidia chinensis var. chinensis TaxID=1590841 RepID=A0A2R6P3R4_ACTCC|nr:Myosin-4 like [Actinidia chinensis var. chinensis]